MGKSRSRTSNVPLHIGSGPGERIEQTVLKRRKKIETVHADKVRRGLAQQKAAGEHKKLRKQVFRNARDYINNFKRREHNKKEMSRRQKVHIKQPVVLPSEFKGMMALAIRVKGDDIPETCRRMLSKWKLNKMYEGAFLSLSESNLQALHLLKDYVKWGYPTPDQIKVLIRTRGYTLNDSGMRIPISGNALVEQKLGDQNILCLEDMEHAIANHTEEFDACVHFLAPFRFEPPEKDETELERRTRERNTNVGEKSFASFLLNNMPEVPQKAPNTTAAETISKKKRKLLANKK
eukprot:TRINITY_DN4642_c0_g2_i1.p1 TRINITY_DN4642_c0_g2~~TRINITY_DN4642_c0_g2_i1.p1  ORF type:complete len:292 (+),score=82.64 TRINITY_DN4642_c0_g2_i1:54-929(+)